MRTGRTLYYALSRQIASNLNGSGSRQISKPRDHSTKSAAVLAFIGLGMSGFSLKQLAKTSRKF